MKSFIKNSPQSSMWKGFQQQTSMFQCMDSWWSSLKGSTLALWAWCRIPTTFEKVTWVRDFHQFIKVTDLQHQEVANLLNDKNIFLSSCHSHVCARLWKLGQFLDFYVFQMLKIKVAPTVIEGNVVVIFSGELLWQVSKSLILSWFLTFRVIF